MPISKRNVCILAGAVIGIGILVVIYSFIFPSTEPGKIEIRFDIPLAVSLAFVGIGVVLLFAFLPNDKRPVLTFATAVSGGIAAILSAFYVGQALEVNTRRDKITRSVAIMKQLDGPKITAVRHFVLKTVDVKKMTPEEMYDSIETDDELWNSVRTVFNQMENMSLSIQTGYADEEFLYKELAHMVPYYRGKLQPFIEGIRKKYNYPYMYIEFEKLANSWQAGMLLSTGKKAPPL